MFLHNISVEANFFRYPPFHMSDFSLLQNAGELPDAGNMRFGIIVTEWNRPITDALLKGALDALKACGVSESSISVRRVPGSFELVYGCSRMAQHGYIDAIIALGCVIRGDTPHFDYICSGTTEGLVHLNLEGKIPVINGVLTVNTEEQALERANRMNKGAEFAITAVKMVAYAHSFD